MFSGISGLIIILKDWSLEKKGGLLPIIAMLPFVVDEDLTLLFWKFYSVQVCCFFQFLSMPQSFYVDYQTQR